MSGVMATFLLMPFLALAQTTEQPEWCNEYVSGVNKEEAVQIAIPFTDEKQANGIILKSLQLGR